MLLAEVFAKTNVPALTVVGAAIIREKKAKEAGFNLARLRQACKHDDNSKRCAAGCGRFAKAGGFCSSCLTKRKGN